VTLRAEKNGRALSMQNGKTRARISRAATLDGLREHLARDLRADDFARVGANHLALIRAFCAAMDRSMRP
jgi:hypothetical protein